MANAPRTRSTREPKDEGTETQAATSATDAAISATTPGAQPATDATEEERDNHAQTIADLTERVAELEAERGAGGKVTREDVLSLHRKLEALANHLNFRLPG